MNLAHLPVSDQTYRFRPLTGADEMLLWSSGLPADGLSSAGTELDVAATLLARTACTERGGALEIEALPVTDLDALLLRFRASLFGETLQAEATCPQAECGARMDVAFDISSYLESQAPETPRGVRRLTPGESDGPGIWFAFTKDTIRFRPPTVGDTRAAAWEASPADALFERCVVSVEPVRPVVRARIEKALSALSPTLGGEIDGACPECASPVTMGFEPRAYALRELRAHAAFLMDEIHLIAAMYHWTETAILDLPSTRRRAYAERIRDMVSVNRRNGAATEGSRR